MSNLPILLLIAFYERQSTDMSAVTFYETLTTAAERVYDTLPRRLKRLSTAPLLYVATVSHSLPHSAVRGLGGRWPGH